MTALNTALGTYLRRAARMVTPAAVRNHVSRAPGWAIGLYEGPTPGDLAPRAGEAAPILTRDDVSDVEAVFVADPLALHRDGTWHLFFEVLNRGSGRGEIGVATSPDLRTWTYEKIVLAEPFHLSYPLTFEYDDSVFMVPEASTSGGVRLYRATRFPTEWAFEATVMTGPVVLDATVFEHDGLWWMFCDTSRRHTHDTLRLYHAAAPFGPWTEHPASPVIAGDARAARPAGRVVATGGRLLRFAQDCAVRYGMAVHAFEITELTPTTYAERPATEHVVGPGPQAWRRHAMHTVDAHAVDGRWLAFVDGS